MCSSRIYVYVSDDLSFEMPAYVRKSAEKHTAGAARDQRGAEEWAS